jgi:V/A-type H+-transporting ATPase subunit C
VLEGRLLTRGVFERLLDAPDLHERKRILADTAYGPYLEPVHTPDDVEDAIEQSLADLYDEFLEVANLPASVVRFFRLPADAANVKSYVKGRVLGLPADGRPSTLGTFEPERVEQPETLPEPFRSVVLALLSADPAPGGEDVEVAIDRALSEARLEAARQTRSDFIVDLARLEIDLANVRALLRSRMLGRPGREIANMLLEEGALDPQRLVALASVGDVDTLANALVGFPLLRGADAPMLADPMGMDVELENVVVAGLRRARLVAVGIEPVVGYVMARRAEAIALRTVLIGSMAGMADATLRGRLRDMYV